MSSVLYLLVIAFVTCFWQGTAYTVPLEWIYYIHKMLYFLLYRYEYMNMDTFYIDRPTCSYKNTETQNSDFYNSHSPDKEMET